MLSWREVRGEKVEQLPTNASCNSQVNLHARKAMNLFCLFRTFDAMRSATLAKFTNDPLILTPSLILFPHPILSCLFTPGKVNQCNLRHCPPRVGLITRRIVCFDNDAEGKHTMATGGDRVAVGASQRTVSKPQVNEVLQILRRCDRYSKPGT